MAQGYYIVGSGKDSVLIGNPAIGYSTDPVWIKIAGKFASFKNELLSRTAEMGNVYREYRYNTHEVQVCNITPTYRITPKFKTAEMRCKPNSVVLFSGQTKSAIVNNISDKQDLGNVVGNVGGLEFKFSVNQFVNIKVDVPNAKVQSLPIGFTFTSSTIKGKAERAGTYVFNLVSEATLIPVTFIVSNLTRIS